MSYTVGNSVKAFDDAIEAGFLSSDPNSPRYAGDYMYMETTGKMDIFKHIDTRRTIFRNTNIQDAIAAMDS